MSETKPTHTPGEWIYAMNDDGVIDADAEVFLCDDGPGRCVIARVESQPQCEANARLIAAAPELLDACKVALNDRMFKDWPDVAPLLIAAIAKAEGRS